MVENKEMLEKLSRVILELYRGSQEVPMASFQDWALEQLQPLLEFDSAVWLTAVLQPVRDSATFHTRHFYRQPPELLSDWLKCQGATTFPRKLYASPGTAIACTPSLDMEPEVAAHCHRYGIEQILTVALMDPIAGINEMMSLYRSDIAHPFSEAERLLQQALAPHLSETWRMCRMRHLSRFTQPACAINASSAGADSQGTLHLVDSGFTRLLLEEWPGWNGPQLPPELLQAHRRNEPQYVGRCSVYLLFGLDDHVLLRGRRKQPIDELSLRELEVARRYAEGYSHKEIAQMLDLSPATIRNHLGNAYCKLGIDNKAALAAIVNEHDLSVSRKITPAA